MARTVQVEAAQLKNGLKKAYQAVQVARLCFGDVTVVGELIGALVAEGVAQEAAHAVADSLDGCHVDLKTAEAALQFVTQNKLMRIHWPQQKHMPWCLY